MKRWSLLKKIESDIAHHLVEYCLLVFSAICYLIFLSLFKGEHSKQLIISFFFVAYYIAWGIMHHARDQSLHLKVVLEYILIGALAMLLLRSLLV
ncbi:MAG: hypothetical protein UZ22_OP11002000328 [Microgenomates bacterium OLB23]|nr:MAG: hypothetical protein UZ22_OP11002000328 [Microgenomates bacterium OLB23]